MKVFRYNALVYSMVLGIITLLTMALLGDFDSTILISAMIAAFFGYCAGWKDGNREEY